ncbi:unnamed protein product [Closterium sp. Naga37s-1]|nr:unnamed protein product [Closterium sp. Naga37s-1]
MELNDVIGGNAVPDGDHLAGPCDMDGDMDGDLLEGDDVLGASWDACDHTGNLEAILRSSYQSAKHSQSGSATGQNLAQSSIAGILSHIHASASSAAAAVAEAAKGGGTERARGAVEKLDVLESSVAGADTYCATAGGLCDSAVLRSPSPPRGSIPQRLSLLQSTSIPARSIRPSPFRRVPSSPAFSPAAAPAATSSPSPSHPCAFPPAPPTHRSMPYPSQPGLPFPPGHTPFPAPAPAPAPSAQRGLPPYPRLPFFPNYHQAYPAAALPLPPMPASFLAGTAGGAASAGTAGGAASAASAGTAATAASAGSAAAAGATGATALSAAGEAAGAGVAGASATAVPGAANAAAKVSTPTRIPASAALNAPVNAAVSASLEASSANAVVGTVPARMPPHMPARALMPFPGGTMMPAPAFFTGSSMGHPYPPAIFYQSRLHAAASAASAPTASAAPAPTSYTPASACAPASAATAAAAAAAVALPPMRGAQGFAGTVGSVKGAQHAGGWMSKQMWAGASLPPSPPAATGTATESTGNQIGRDCNEGKKTRVAQQEAEAGGMDAVGQGRRKRLKTADEIVMSAPEGEAKAEDATMEEAAVKAEQQDRSQAKEPSMQCATACGDPAARASARSPSGGAGPVVERAVSMDGRDAATDVESATLGQLYSTIAQSMGFKLLRFSSNGFLCASSSPCAARSSQLDTATRDCIRSALLRLATSAQNRAMPQSAATATTAVAASPAASVRDRSAAGGNASDAVAAASAAAAAKSTCVSAAPSAGEAADHAFTNTPSRTTQTSQEDLNPTATEDAASSVTPVTASEKQQQQQHQPHAQQQQGKQEPGQQQQVTSEVHSNSPVPDSNTVDRVIAKLLFMAPPTPASTHAFPASSPSSSHSTHPAASASHAPSHSHAASTLDVHSHSATSLTASFCSSATPTSIPQTSSTPHAHATSSSHPPPLAPPPPPPPPPPAALPHPPHTRRSPSSRAAFPAVPPSFPRLLQPSATHPPFRQSPHAPHYSAMFPYTACFLPCCSAPDACSYTQHQNPSHQSSLHPYSTPPQHAHFAPVSSAGPRDWMTWHGQSQPAGEMWVVPGQHSRAAGAMLPAASLA